MVEVGIVTSYKQEKDEKIRWTCIPSYKIIPKRKSSVRHPSLWRVQPWYI